MLHVPAAIISLRLCCLGAGLGTSNSSEGRRGKIFLWDDFASRAPKAIFRQQLWLVTKSCILSHLFARSRPIARSNVHHTVAYPYVYVYIYIYICVFVFVYIYMYIYTYTYACTYVNISTSPSASTRPRVVCMCFWAPWDLT